MAASDGGLFCIVPLRSKILADDTRMECDRGLLERAIVRITIGGQLTAPLLQHSNRCHSS
ncbi:hypothetical protein [Stenomitos frigidus]|uniref:hypothetical protein n=1 Tax=Stenomitos frigidus TaxID=1886765 RepID=UPI0015E79B49